AQDAAPLSELRLDSNVAVRLPSRPVKQGDVVTAYVSLAGNSTVDLFVLRIPSSPRGNSQHVYTVGLRGQPDARSPWDRHGQPWLWKADAEARELTEPGVRTQARPARR
ncbi:transmembrane protein 132D-like, partial [Suricata suricatta]|uniref:transmembrane protein 132D-like n=1 Tax=Suricata suricatta TaxID=37032 RepID=UPI001155AA19